MKKDITYIIVILAIIVGISVIGNKFYAPNIETPGEEMRDTAITLRIDGLNLTERYDVSEDTSVLALLQEIDKSDADLKLKTKEYSGLGALVISMGNKENGKDNKYWQYYVNGIMPQVGADKYILQNGDIVEWRFAASEF